MKNKQKILSLVSAIAVASATVTTAFPVVGYAQENNNIKNIREKEIVLSGNCGVDKNEASVHWNAVKNGVNEDGEETYTLEISGKGAIKDFEQKTQPWKDILVNKVIVNEGITRIGNFSFDQLKYKEIELPSTLNSIGSWGLCNFYVKNYNIAVGNNSFSVDNNGVLYDLEKTHLYGYPGGKDEVDEYYIPDTVRTIEDGAIANAKINKLIYGKNVENIGAWQSCTAKEVFIEDGNTEFKFGKWGFGSFKNLEKITLNRVKEIPGRVDGLTWGFENLKNLTEVNFSEGLEKIGTDAFLGTSIKELIFPDSLKTIGNGAFAAGKKEGTLEKIVYGSGIKDVGSKENGTPFAGQKNVKVIDLTKVNPDIFPGSWNNGSNNGNTNFNNVYPGRDTNGIQFYFKNKDYLTAKGNIEWNNANTSHYYFVFDDATVSKYPTNENEMPLPHKQDEYCDGWHEYNRANDECYDEVITSLDQAKKGNVFKIKEWKKSKYTLNKSELDFGAHTYGESIESQDVNVIYETGTGDSNAIEIDSYKITDESLFDIEKDTNDLTKVKVTPKKNINAGNYEETLTITTKGGSEHSIPLKLIVNKAKPSYQIPQNLVGKLGNQLETVKLPKGFEWKNGNEKLAKEGKNKFIARYNPDDMLNYEVIEDIEIIVNVKKDTPINPSIPSVPSIPSTPSKPSKPVYTHKEVIGANRYETAAKVADELGSYDNVVLVNATSTMSDGLAASGLAGKENGAILLTKKDSIPKATMDRIKKVKKVYIIGGENAISQKVANQITAANIKVERIGGKNRVETSELVAEKLGNYSNAFIVNGFKGEADAMSASAIAARYEAPILLTNGKTSTHAKKSGVEYYVVGGTSVVNKSIADKYNAERLAGKDRYATNREVIDEFYSGSDKLYLANGETLVDALTASTIAKNHGIVLVNKKSDNSVLKDKNTVQIGGMNFNIDFDK